MSEEYNVVASLLKDAEEKKDKLLEAQQDFNTATVNMRKLALQERIDRFRGVQSTASIKAAEALQKHIGHIQSSYDYWDGPEPTDERVKLEPQIVEVDQLIAELSSLLATLPPPKDLK